MALVNTLYQWGSRSDEIDELAEPIHGPRKFLLFRGEKVVFGRLWRVLQTLTDGLHGGTECVFASVEKFEEKEIGMLGFIWPGWLWGNP